LKKVSKSLVFIKYVPGIFRASFEMVHNPTIIDTADDSFVLLWFLPLKKNHQGVRRGGGGRNDPNTVCTYE
jgi:hypothetical protein